MCALLPAMRPLVLLCGCLLLSGYGALMGPKNIRGSEGDTVSIQCTYEEKLRNHQKYWCRKTEAFFFPCSDTIYARADGQENTEGRVSIQDSPQELRFNVTLRALTLEDSGEYWCGIRRLGFDESHLVSLVILPGTSGPPTHLDSTSAKDTSLFPSSSSSKSRVYSTRIRILAPVLVLLALLLASGLCALGRHMLQWRKKDSRESMCSLCRSSYSFQLATETQRNEKDHHSHLAEGGALGTREQEEWGTLALLSGEENLPRGYLLQGPSMAPAERDHPSPREERLQNHEPLGKGQVPEYSMIHVVKSTTRPATSPCTEMQCPDQTSEQEEAPFQDPDGEAVPGPPLHMSEELKRAVFVSV